jgi:hypothetical protein
MNRKALAIAPIVAFIAVILFLETAIGVLLLVTPMLVNAKIGTNDILNGAITNPKIALHAVNQTQLRFVLKTSLGTNG